MPKSSKMQSAGLMGTCRFGSATPHVICRPELGISSMSDNKTLCADCKKELPGKEPDHFRFIETLGVAAILCDSCLRERINASKIIS